MNNKQKAKIILRILNKTYPKVPIPLNYKNTFTLLVSVLLSAQCTDVNVNNVTKNIYPKYNKPSHFVKLGRRKIERLIKRIGIFRVKAKSIFYLSKTLIENYKKILIITCPVIPHFANECLSMISKNQTYNWPPYDEKMLVENDVEIVIQINGKKRGLLKVNRGYLGY